VTVNLAGLAGHVQDGYFDSHYSVGYRVSPSSAGSSAVTAVHHPPIGQHDLALAAAATHVGFSGLSSQGGGVTSHATAYSLSASAPGEPVDLTGHLRSANELGKYTSPPLGRDKQRFQRGDGVAHPPLHAVGLGVLAHVR
jgi:hypothetical protein